MKLIIKEMNNLLGSVIIELFFRLMKELSELIEYSPFVKGTSHHNSFKHQLVNTTRLTLKKDHSPKDNEFNLGRSHHPTPQRILDKCNSFTL